MTIKLKHPSDSALKRIKALGNLTLTQLSAGTVQVTILDKSITVQHVIDAWTNNGKI